MGTIASSAPGVTKLAYFRPRFPVWLSFFSPKTLTKITILAPQNAHFQLFSKAHKPVQTYNTLIPSDLQVLQNSLIYDQTVTKSQEAPSRKSICKNYSESAVE